MLALALTLLIAQVPAGPSGSGRQDYATYCASCHGADLRGTVDGPNIRGVGAADVDFMLQTGRMPAAVPWIEIGHRGAQLPQHTIDALVTYVTSVEPGGEPIPWVTTGGNLRHGEELYRQNCEHCHGVYAQGAYIGGNEWAPSLRETSVTQVAEAIRIG
ncbi:MAG TPA: cytochrome c, partial [Candidatus Elarobacter sp.]